jgi:hypothetical protein
MDVDKKACESAADAQLAVDEANAIAVRDEILVMAEHHN